MQIVGIKFVSQPKIYSFDAEELELNIGDKVVVETVRGLELGTVMTIEKENMLLETNEPIKPVLRKATKEDILSHEKNLNNMPAIKIKVKEIVKARELDMKIVSVESTLDNSKLIINFTADNRVDFRELVKDLAGEFKTRIELRQIGSRDEVKIVGGMGACGRPCCCTKNTGDFEHVSIKMAKTQNLSLNPNSINGLCGRLMCCLAYENEHYEEATKMAHKIGSQVKTPDGVGEVMYNDLLKRTTSVKLGDEIKDYKMTDIKEI